MKQRLYTIYDRLSEESSPPFVAKNDDVAKRAFRSLNPAVSEDYDVLFLGTWDNETNRFDLLAVPTVID